MQTEGPSRAALCPAQTQGSCLSLSRNKAAHTKLPLWILPLWLISAQGFPQLSLVCWASTLQWLLCSPSAHPASPWAHFSFCHTQHPWVRASPGLTHCTRHQLLVLALSSELCGSLSLRAVRYCAFLMCPWCWWFPYVLWKGIMWSLFQTGGC